MKKTSLHTTTCKVGCNYLHDIVVFIQKDKHLPLLSFNNNKYNSCVSCSIHFYDKLFQLSHKTQRNAMACYKMIYRRVLFQNELNADLFKSMFYWGPYNYNVHVYSDFIRVPFVMWYFTLINNILCYAVNQRSLWHIFLRSF